jgi:hypothetical protein
MEWIKNTGIAASLIVLSGIAVQQAVNKSDGITEKTEKRAFPNQIDFAGEQAPLNVSDVRERLDRELLVNANLDATTLLIIKRANRAFPVIEPILKQYGVPDDFKYLAVIESGLVNVVSPAGARAYGNLCPIPVNSTGWKSMSL